MYCHYSRARLNHDRAAVPQSTIMIDHRMNMRDICPDNQEYCGENAAENAQASCIDGWRHTTKLHLQSPPFLLSFSTTAPFFVAKERTKSYSRRSVIKPKCPCLFRRSRPWQTTVLSSTIDRSSTTICRQSVTNIPGITSTVFTCARLSSKCPGNYEPNTKRIINFSLSLTALWFVSFKGTLRSFNWPACLLIPSNWISIYWRTQIVDNPQTKN